MMIYEQGRVACSRRHLALSPPVTERGDNHSQRERRMAFDTVWKVSLGAGKYISGKVTLSSRK